MSAQAKDNATLPKPAPAGPAPSVPLFGRVVTAIVTPFKRSGAEIDYALAQRLVTTLVANGSEALVIAGTNGKSPTPTLT